MANNLKVYVLGHYRPGAADGLGEFNFQNVNMLKESIDFHFLEFVNDKGSLYHFSAPEGPVIVHRFGSLNVSLNALPSGFKFWLKAQDFENSVFHLNHIYNVRNFLVARLLMSMKIPYLITPHDSYVYCNEFRSTRPLLKRWYRDLFVRLIDKYVLDHAALIQALTPRCLPCLALISKNEVVVVANQVSDLGLSQDMSVIKPVFCFIGRSEIYQKGIDRALRGFARLRNLNPDIKGYQFKIVGPADEASDRLRRRICMENDLLPGRDVILCGRVEEVERNRILTESIAYIHLSRFEGFGLSVIQALSAGKPVIISSQVPTHDKISAYGAGYVVNTDEEVAEAMASVIALPDEEYRKMAMNARLCYEKEFHPAVIGPQLLRLYYKAAGKI
ncbi:glycosyltransferase [Daejeonella sp. H1SJ63]|jgi:glycosyltransferase involved in cell wall biosynthesis|uniref:glycosyltransferase family 4 protein n=1 Tax=Daejeonella sp. H1SJ63 TaxID=3034145 RepID=UPI0023ED2762|nr:glycosyltransferase [Daejeonella sp. H1SJ63]